LKCLSLSAGWRFFNFMENRKIQVGVIGDSTADPDKYRFSQEVGKLLSDFPCLLITGGRGGVMEAVSRGMIEHGGIVVGILPSFSLDEANDYCTVRLATGLGHARNSITALSADLLIAIGGGAGTLTEMGFAWIYRKPIIAVTGFGGWSEELAGKKIDDRAEITVYRAGSLVEIREIISNLLPSLRV
jgi:hypothetical protein